MAVEPVHHSGIGHFLLVLVVAPNLQLRRKELLGFFKPHIHHMRRRNGDRGFEWNCEALAVFFACLSISFLDDSEHDDGLAGATVVGDHTTANGETFLLQSPGDTRHLPAVELEDVAGRDNSHGVRGDSDDRLWKYLCFLSQRTLVSLTLEGPFLRRQVSAIDGSSCLILQSWPRRLQASRNCFSDMRVCLTVCRADPRAAVLAKVKLDYQTGSVQVLGENGRSSHTESTLLQGLVRRREEGGIAVDQERHGGDVDGKRRCCLARLRASLVAGHFRHLAMIMWTRGHIARWTSMYSTPFCCWAGGEVVGLILASIA